MERPIIYPADDYNPETRAIADGFRVSIFAALCRRFADDPNVLVATKLPWHPAEGGKARLTSGVLVAFGRPKGEREAYRQWEEGGIPPRVLLDVEACVGDPSRFIRRLAFLKRHGVEEYLLYNPWAGAVDHWTRRDGRLRSARGSGRRVTSPALGVRFDVSDGYPQMYGPDGVDLTQSDVDPTPVIVDMTPPK